MTSVLIIDIGTNSILSLSALLNNDQTITILDEQLYSPRLGESYHFDGMISETSINKAIAALQDILVKNKIKKIKTIGTQIFRKAKNSEKVLKRINKETGLEIQVLTAEEEAIGGFQGAVADLPLKQNYLTLDIGGGSTEMTLGNSDQIIQTVSLGIGAVQIKNKFSLDPPSKFENSTQAVHYIKSQLKSAALSGFYDCRSIIGIGGTVTTLAAMEQNLAVYLPNQVHHYILSGKMIHTLIDKIQGLSENALHKWLKFDPKRSDIILSGALILACYMDYFSWNQIQVSNHGLRYGLALTELKKGSF